ncbi:MAG: hypothetical protein F6K19_44050 [Cyanothece sp. SIO1E1]|nr:hypothetical protein [Cyanothece sp. SIO1E1]
MNPEVDYITIASNKPKGKRPYFFNDPAVERVLNITMAVASELAVARERVDTLERILEEKGILSREEIETYVPKTKAIEEQRQTWHSEYISRVLRIVQQEMEELANPDKTLAEIADDIDQM